MENTIENTLENTMDNPGVMENLWTTMVHHGNVYC